MAEILHKAATRGTADHGWLLSRHTFSFADYYNPERMGFGALRVINDDIVKPGHGFPQHPHKNMEIISIPLQGALTHEDSMGNRHVLEVGDIQMMSAGKGLMHSEFNASRSHDVAFLQIWILPKQLDIDPRYEQRRFAAEPAGNRFAMLIAPDGDAETLWINQDAYISQAFIDADRNVRYDVRVKGHGVYLFLISGAVEVAGHRLESRDAIGLTEQDAIPIRAHETSRVLCLEVPMS